MIDKLTEQLRNTNVAGAISILMEDFICANETVLIGLPLGNRTTTVWHLLDEWEPKSLATYAGPIIFRGGPEKKWVLGTLLNLLIDKFLCKIYTDKLKTLYFERLDKNGDPIIKVHV